MIHSLMYLLNHGDLPYNYVKLPDGNKHLKCPRYLRDLPSVSEKNMSFWKILQHQGMILPGKILQLGVVGNFPAMDLWGQIIIDIWRFPIRKISKMKSSSWKIPI